MWFVLCFSSQGADSENAKAIPTEETEELDTKLVCSRITNLPSPKELILCTWYCMLHKIRIHILHVHVRVLQKKKISVVGFITPDYTNYWQVFRSIGYKSVNIDVGIPFDSARGLIPNTAGRVDSSKGMPLLLCLLLMHRHCMIVKLCDIVPVLWFKQYYKVSVKSPA